MAARYLVPYYRVSTDNKGQDTERQTLSCEPWAEREGYHLLPAEHEEESAFKVPALQRPRFIAACERAQAAKAEGLLLETPDRFSRQNARIATWELVEVFRRYEIEIYFACMTKEMQTSPWGQVGIFLMAQGGHIWAVEHSKKIVTGNVRARAKGVRLGRKPKEVTYEEEQLIAEWRKEHGWETISNLLNEHRGVHKLTDKKVAKARSISASALKRWWRAKTDAEAAESGSPGEMYSGPEGADADQHEAVSGGGA